MNTTNLPTLGRKFVWIVSWPCGKLQAMSASDNLTADILASMVFFTSGQLCANAR